VRLVFFNNFEFKLFQYNLLELKDMCAKSLKDNMTIENIVGILDVADMHNCQELKEKAVAFIGR
jgi:hypothetical protein